MVEETLDEDMKMGHNRDRVRVSELAYVRLRVPDLDLQTEFLENFGLIRADDHDGKIHFRPTDPVHYCYEIEEGPRHFLGFAFHAKSRGDLVVLSRRHGLEIEPIGGPGGGERVRLTEPNGYAIDVVFGIEAAAPIEIKRQVMNTGSDPLVRKNELFRLQMGKPTPIKRLAHVVLGSPNVSETVQWFVDTLGMIISDDVRAGPQREVHVGSFIRIDEGDKFVDHHAVFIINSPQAGLHHISFEVPDIDAVLHDHEYLEKLGKYEHVWGVGRHLLGSQVFDYWADPYGYQHEHWADSDRLDANVPSNEWDAPDVMISQWGGHATERAKQVVA
uniref:VOC family protein n=1 Tax=uncultured Sphingomonas sp. TaxID=158754 RepID=UPI0035CCA256